MLEPTYFDGKEETLVSYYQKLEDWIFLDIARRIMQSNGITGTADREIYKLEQMGLHKKEILKKLSSLTGKTTGELRELLQDAVLTSYNDEKAIYLQAGIELSSPLENTAVRQIMNAEWQKVSGEIDNLTKTTIDGTASDLVKLLNEAEMKVSSGLMSYQQATIEVLDRYAGQGIEVNYPTGTTRSIESAVRCCVVTSMNQTAAQVSNAYIKEHKVDYVLVSAHEGARHDKNNPTGISSHDWWQGKAYKIDGSEPGFPNLLESTGYDIDETGKGKVVNPLGLHGYNCRHSHQGWFKDLRNPYLDENGNVKIDIGKSRERYELEQRQRTMERSIRKTKRRIAMKRAEIEYCAETDVRDILKNELAKMENLLSRQSEKYNYFCKENNLTVQYDRLHTIS